MSLPQALACDQKNHWLVLQVPDSACFKEAIRAFIAQRFVLLISVLSLFGTSKKFLHNSIAIILLPVLEQIAATIYIKVVVMESSLLCASFEPD